MDYRTLFVLPTNNSSVKAEYQVHTTIMGEQEAQWVLTTNRVLDDDTASQLSFVCQPQFAILGTYVEVHDRDGIRIGQIQSAQLQSPHFFHSVDIACCRIKLT